MKSIRSLCVLLVLAASVACDYAIPKASCAEEIKAGEKELSGERRFNFAKECAIVGKRHFDDLVKESERPDLPFAGWYKDDEYHYNARLNTCLIFFTLTVIQKNGNVLGPNAFVVDVFSNKTLLNMQLDGLSLESFAIQKEALFRE